MTVVTVTIGWDYMQILPNDEWYWTFHPLDINGESNANECRIFVALLYNREVNSYRCQSVHSMLYTNHVAYEYALFPGQLIALLGLRPSC